MCKLTLSIIRWQLKSMGAHIHFYMNMVLQSHGTMGLMIQANIVGFQFREPSGVDQTTFCPPEQMRLRASCSYTKIVLATLHCKLCQNLFTLLFLGPNIIAGTELTRGSKIENYAQIVLGGNKSYGEKKWHLCSYFRT